MLEKLVIEGGQPLSGTVRISGAKNSALPILASTLLSDKTNVIHNVPKLQDVHTIVKLLQLLGAEIIWEERTLTINCAQIKSVEAPYDLVRKMRASVLLLGPLLARAQRARISLPGGCAIGARPINLHLQALNRMGCDIKLVEGYVEAYSRKLVGNRIRLTIPTVTGTMNVVMAASLAAGTTIIDNAAREPEVVDLVNSLNQRGAKIHGAGSSQITIEGVDRLGGMNYTIMPDRIECGTYLTAAMLTGGSIRTEDIRSDSLQAVLDKLEASGAVITYGTSDDGQRPWLEIVAPNRPKAVDIVTQPFPGFPTDMQAQFLALLTIAAGNSVVTENIFENRFMHVSELQRMGARLQIRDNAVLVEGVEGLSGAPMMATDLRASASLVLAALAAKGSSEIRRIYHLDRGYERMDEKLRALGARIQRVRQ